MATIAIKNNDGTFTASYLHWNGHPSVVLPILEKWYGSEGKVRHLLAFGNILGLGHRPAECYFYERDRGEDNHKDEDYPRLDKVIGFVYVFDNGEWTLLK